MLKERYLRCVPAISEAEWETLHGKSVCIVGCGGLGGYVLEYLARAGVGRITVVDGDRFSVSNWNRQLLSNEENLQKSKATEAASRAARINSHVTVIPVEAFLTEENGEGILAGHDLVIDALDNVKSRRILGGLCDRLNIPLIHGAIRGWMAQAAVVLPGSRMLENLYPPDGEPVTDKSCMPFTPALCASIQAAEAVKLLCGRKASLESKLLFIDLADMSVHTIRMDAPDGSD